MKFCKAEWLGFGTRASLTIAALMVMAASANAQQLPHSLRDALLGHKGQAGARRAAAPPVARYVFENGGGFVFDQAAPQPLMKFDNSAEVWVLSAQPASRGDTIYRNDLGEPVLRVTKLGGMILFTDDAPMGAAAALTGRASSIQPPAIMSFGVFVQRVKIAADRASRAAQHQIEFSTVEDVRPETSMLAADSATVVAEAFERMARKGDRSIIAKIFRVMLAEGRKPAAAVKDGSLTITYSPDQGLSGRPSSKRIIKVMNR